MSTLDLPMFADDRDMRGFRPLKALHHFRNLVADKEDTKEVFFIIDALKGNKTRYLAQAFMESETARDFMQREDKQPIAEMLDDHARWADCEEGTVARTYIDFMKREGLTAAGLVAESYAWQPREKRPTDKAEWYLCRLRDTHDLFHVLTGYGRDALGEASLLGFSYEQNYNLGVKFIAYAAAREIKKTTGTKAPIYASIREGRRLGKAAQKLAHMDVEAVMRMDISEARAQLGLGKPVVYRECLAILKSEGYDESDIGLSPDGAPQAQAV